MSLSIAAPAPGSRIGGRSGILGPLILSASTVAALGRLIAHTSPSVLLPLLGAIVIADVVVVRVLRPRVHVVLAFGLGWVASMVGLVLLVDPVLLDPASPHFLHAALLSRQLRAAHFALANDGTPLPRLNGVVIAVGVMGAAAASLTRVIWILQRESRPAGSRRLRTLVPCLAPSGALFLYSSLVSAEQGRVAAAAAYVAGVLVFVAISDRATSDRATSPGTGGGGAPWAHAARRARPAMGALIACGVVSLAIAAAGVGLSGMRLTVFQVSSPPAPIHPATPLSSRGAPASLLTGVSLVDHLLATELQQSDLVVFRAHSPVATYWQVGTLSSFNGTAWVPVPDVNSALGGAGDATAGSIGATALPAASPAHTFTAHVAIADFVSRLLPAPPDTVAVEGLAGATAVAGEGVLAPAASSPGTSYTVTAGIGSALPTSADHLSSDDPLLAPYLALPAQPSIVTQLAHEAVGDARTLAAKAQALVNWFRSGQFRYTLDPPATSGSDPLVQFLTVTKAGYCAQFAGAYGVLARTLGIPTRLAVGFTVGQPGTGDAYTVTGADAHVWPQVYLGRGAGWVSVEPTPPATADVREATGVLGPSVVPPPAAAGATPGGVSTQPVTSQVSRATQPAPARGAGRGSRPGHRTHSSTGRPGSSPWWILATALGALLLLALVGRRVWRSRSSAQEEGLPPDQRVVHAWERALGALRRRGLPRLVTETPGEYAARVRTAEEASAQRVEADAVAHLAALVELACYTEGPCTPGQVARARALSLTIVAANRSSRTHRRRRQRERSLS